MNAMARVFACRTYYCLQEKFKVTERVFKWKVMVNINISVLRNKINRVSCSLTMAQHHWTKKRKRENKDFLSKMHCNLVVEIMELNSPGSIGRRYINGYFMVPLFSLTDQSMLLSAILSDKLLLFSIWIYKSPVCFYDFRWCFTEIL